ncbi:hypothetical protein, partial [Pseudomonas syringae]|uniref:hypothetical protein n=1 Tax=Pseudomonas syringae TaxID=317 RepID=UPI001C650DF5
GRACCWAPSGRPEAGRGSAFGGGGGVLFVCGRVRGGASGRACCWAPSGRPEAGRGSAFGGGGGVLFVCGRVRG